MAPPIDAFATPSLAPSRLGLEDKLRVFPELYQVRDEKRCNRIDLIEYQREGISLGLPVLPRAAAGVPGRRSPPTAACRGSPPQHRATMNQTPITDIDAYMTDLGRRARAASRALARADTGAKDAALLAIADAIDRSRAAIAAANRPDLEAGAAKGLDAALLDRLELTPRAHRRHDRGAAPDRRACRTPSVPSPTSTTAPPVSRSGGCGCRWGSSASSTSPAPT